MHEQSPGFLRPLDSGNVSSYIPTPGVTQCELPAESFGKLAISALGIDSPWDVDVDVRGTEPRESIKVGIIGAFNCHTSCQLALSLAGSGV